MNESFFLNGKKLDGFRPLRALLYGEGVFETFRWKNSPPVFLSRHLERMCRGAEFLDIPVPDETQTRLLIEKAVSAVSGDDLHVKVCLLGEGDALFYATPDASSLLLSIKPRAEAPKTVSLDVFGERRAAGNAIFSFKTLNYLQNIVAKRKARAGGFDEVLFLNTDSCVTETSSHNIFWVKGKRLFTPSESCGLLPGVIRKVLLELCPQLGYEAVRGGFELEKLLQSDYAFITNSIAGIVYVREVGGDSMPSPPPSYEIIRKSLLMKLGW